MKRIIFAALAIFALASCSRQDEPIPATADGIEMSVNFSSAGHAADTRAFFDAGTEEWEKRVTSLIIYVFNANGEHIMRRTFTESELAARSAKFTLPIEADGQTCGFYAVANYDPGDLRTRKEEFLLKLGGLSAQSVMGAWGDVSTGNCREEGFIMTDVKHLAVNYGTTSQLNFRLERFVAKIALKIDVDPAFSAKYYGGDIKVTHAALIWYSANTSLFDYSGYEPHRSESTAYGQFPGVVDGSSCNLWYSGVIPFKAGMHKPCITLRALFDQDGDWKTGDDQYYYDYTFEVDGSGGGEIKRNAYYRINGTITGIDALDNQALFTVTQWEVEPVNDVGDINF